MTLIAVRTIDLHMIEGRPTSETCRGGDVWAQANAVLQRWSTFGNRGNKVNFTIIYEDGSDYRGRLELPWFKTFFGREPYEDLGRHMLFYLEHLPQFHWFVPESCERARQEVFHRLQTYEIGGPALAEEVQHYITRIQQLDFSHYPLSSMRGDLEDTTLDEPS